MNPKSKPKFQPFLAFRYPRTPSVTLTLTLTLILTLNLTLLTPPTSRRRPHPTPSSVTLNPPHVVTGGNHQGQRFVEGHDDRHRRARVKG